MHNVQVPTFTAKLYSEESHERIEYTYTWYSYILDTYMHIIYKCMHACIFPYVSTPKKQRWYYRVHVN